MTVYEKKNNNNNTNSNNNDNHNNDNNNNNNDHKNLEIYIKYKRTLLYHLLSFKGKYSSCGSNTNRCEIYVTIVKIKSV